ncbi:YciI family protein [Radicibacter daui]|uniref:YciI family protein n=1 Tax=Radicibacter daui TaxID=3064829 RepID=UPI004046B05E
MSAGQTSPPAGADQYFFCRLVPPRPDFAFTLTGAERALMAQHGAYWRDFMAKGHVVVFGPVVDPAGPWGLGVVRFADKAAARAFADGDPTILAGLGFYFEVLPMLQAIVPEEVHAAS